MSGSAVSDVTTRRTINWVKRVAPKKFDFAPGVQLSGILVDLKKASLRDKRTDEAKPVNHYLVRDVETGDKVFFFGTVELDKNLDPLDVGHYVLITCTGLDKDAGRNGNPMKLFEVCVSRETAPGWANDGTQITDNDLPDREFFG